MRIRTSYLALLGAFSLAGCPAPAATTCPDGRPIPPSGICTLILPDAGPGDDTGPATDTGGVDTGPRVDGGPVGGCGTTGSVGGHCRGAMGGTGGTCASGFRCQNEIRPMGGTVPYTIRTGFGIEQGTNFDPATGFYEELPMAEAVPADDIPIPMATGTLCTNDCDASATMDACGACATCAVDIGTIGVLATYLLYPDDMRPFGNNMGWCRSDCTFDPAVAGATCPGATSMTSNDAHTCSPGSGVCVEGCISDNECRFSFEQTREGFFVSVIDRTSTATCSPTTHRCEWTHAAGSNSVGDACENSNDCTEDVGICLRGGTCAEYECGRAPDTDMTTFVCDGGRGVCLGNGGNMSTICVAGCTMPSDCNPGSTCIPFDAGMTAGSFTGYCLGICDSVLNDPDGTGPMTTADDQLFACQTGEQCDYPDPTADDLDPTGSCRVPCTTTADCLAATPDDGNYCEIVAGSSPAYGFCRWQDQACNYLDLSADCYGGQVCDLLAWPENPGLCVDACAADTDCPTAGDVCVLTGTPARAVCRTPCTTGGPACPMGEICQGTAPTQYCEQMTTM